MSILSTVFIKVHKHSLKRCSVSSLTIKLFIGNTLLRKKAQIQRGWPLYCKLNNKCNVQQCAMISAESFLKSKFKEKVFFKYDLS